MPNLRGKTWDTTTPATVADAQHWEDHLISDADMLKVAGAVQTVNEVVPDENGNVDVVALPEGGTTGQVLTKISNTSGDADWLDPASSGHTIEDPDGTAMTQQSVLQFLNAEVTNDSVNSKTVVDCQGEKGDAATIAVGTVTTLPYGSSATVTNSGSSSAAVFNFGIPEGQPGTGSPTWGNITGTLSNQSDLNTALGNKANSSDLATVATSGSYNDLSNLPTIPTVTDTYSDQSHDGMSGVAVASAVSGKADSDDLDSFIGPVHATVTSNVYSVVFDNLDNSYGYQICINDGIAKFKSVTKGTGTNSGIKLTYVINSTYIDITTGNSVTVQTGSSGTNFYLRAYK